MTWTKTNSDVGLERNQEINMHPQEEINMHEIQNMREEEINTMQKKESHVYMGVVHGMGSLNVGLDGFISSRVGLVY